MAKKYKSKVEVETPSTNNGMERVVTRETVQPNWKAFTAFVEESGGPKINPKHVGIVLTGYKYFQKSDSAVAARAESAAEKEAGQAERESAREARKAERAAAAEERAEKKAARDKASSDKAAKAKKTPAAASGKAVAGKTVAAPKNKGKKQKSAF